MFINVAFFVFTDVSNKLPRIAVNNVERIQSAIDDDAPYSFVIDESPDHRLSCYILLYVADPSKPSIVLDIRFSTTSATNEKVFNIVYDAVQLYRLNRYNCSSFCRDGASYMNVAADDLTGGLLRACVDLTDGSHTCFNALLAGMSCEGLEDITKFFRDGYALTRNSPTRKSNLKILLSNTPVLCSFYVAYHTFLSFIFWYTG